MPVYKMKNGKGWFCSFYCRDFTGKNKRIKKEGFRTQKDAKAYEQAYLQKGKIRVNMPIGELYALYREDCSIRLKPSSVINLERYWKNYLQPYFSSIPCSKTDCNTVRQWQNQMLQRDLSPATQLTAHKTLSAIFNFGIRYYGLSSNPAKACGAIGKSISSNTFWTWDEFQKANHYITTNPANLMLNLLYFSGMRCGEMMALTRKDFDFAKNQIHITKSLTRIQGKNIIMAPKTEKSIRSVVMPDFVMKKAQSYFQTLCKAEAEDLIFPCSVHVIRYAVKKAWEQTGIPKIRVHDLRHSHASLLIEMGFSPLLIAERLGHENIQTTLHVYSHLYPDKQKEVADQLEEKMVRFSYL